MAAQNALTAGSLIGQRKRTGPLGLSLRFRWGAQSVGEYFLAPGREQTFSVGSAPGVDFAMGDDAIGAPAFQAVHFGAQGTTLHFTRGMAGGISRRGAAEQPLEALRDESEDVSDVHLARGDAAWVDLGGVVLEVSYQPAPRAVKVPLADTIDFNALNTLLVMLSLGALFVIAAEKSAQDTELADDLGQSSVRVIPVLTRAVEVQKKVAVAQAKAEPQRGAAGAQAKNDPKEAGKPRAPVRQTRSSPVGQVNEPDRARQMVATLFAGSKQSGLFDHTGLGGSLTAAVGKMIGNRDGDAGGLGGLSIRGSGGGGEGVGERIGIGGLSTRGMGGGALDYGAGVTFTTRKRVSVAIDTQTPEVTGSLDPELIRQVIHAHRSEIRFCYEEQLGRFPKLAGRVGLRFIIGSDGGVATSSITTSSLNNAGVESCIAGRARLWRFPRPKGGGSVLVTYPFVFKQSGE